MKLKLLPQKVWAKAVIGLICIGLAGNELKATVSLETRWFQSPDMELDFLSTDNTQRGAAINPVNDTVVVVSRRSGNGVFVLSGEDGSLLRTLDAGSISGGTFGVNMVGVAEDGVIYVGNLSTSAEFPNFKLYRFSTDEEGLQPELVYEGDPGATEDGATSGQRWGDTLDVRGSGNNTEIVLASRNGTRAAIFQTSDSGVSFTAKEIAISGINNGDIGLGVGFGVGQTLWGTAAGRPIFHIQYDLATGAGSVVRVLDSVGVPAGLSNLAISPDGKYLAATDINSHVVNVYDISDPNSAPVFQSASTMPTQNGNTNGTGALDFDGDTLMVLETNNGVVVFNLIESTTVVAPEIITEPVGGTIFEGSNFEFSIVATGSTPLEYQWYKDGELIDLATSSVLRLEQVSSEQSGVYSVVVKNSAGSDTSLEVQLTIRKPVDPNLLTAAWSLAPGDRTFLGTANTERGLAYNPAGNHLLIVSRNGGLSLNVLDADTGETLHAMDTDPGLVSGGTFPLNMVASGDDGAIYAANLTLDGSTTAFKIYSWESDAPDALPYDSFFGDPGNGAAERWGDSLHARGSGKNTQIIASSRSGNFVAIFTTDDGLNFNSTLIGGVSGGLGVSFGSGNTFWTTSAGANLDLYEFDLEAATATRVVSYDGSVFPSGISPIAFDPAGEFLAGIDLGGGGLLKLFEYRGSDSDPLILLEKPFPVSNPNGNGVGAVAFSTNPRRLFALNTNNGIVAFDLGELTVQPTTVRITNAFINADGQFELQIVGAPGSTVNLSSGSNLIIWGNTQSVELDEEGNGTYTLPVDSSTSALFVRVEKP